MMVIMLIESNRSVEVCTLSSVAVNVSFKHVDEVVL